MPSNGDCRLFNEEAYWSSFRSAVAGLQRALTELGSNVDSNSASIRNPQSHPQDLPTNQWSVSTIEELNSPNPHRHLELIGLEELDKSAYGRNNHVGNEVGQHAHSSTHSSQQTLSIAAHQLAKIRLKLALTESERDELEFKLMQNVSL